MAIIPSPRAQALSAALLLALAVIALYWPAAGFGLVALDDVFYIQDSLAVRAGLGWEGVRLAFAHPYRGLWMPLTLISYQADIAVFGEGPFGHHLVNILLHAANAAIFLLLLLRMTGALGRSALAAALWALHPLRVESVAWVAERKDVLSVFLLLLALAAYLRWVESGRRRSYAAMLAAFAAACAGKPTVSFPVLLLLLDFWPLGRMDRERPWSRDSLLPRLREKIPLFLVAAAFSAIALATRIPPPAGGYALLPRLGHAAAAPFIYLVQTLLPLDLGLRYIFTTWEWVRGATLPLLLALALALMTALAFRAARARPHLAAGWLWYLAALLPVSGIVLFGVQWTSDRFTYLPHLGLASALAWEGAARLPRSGTARRIAAWAASAALLLPLVLLTRAQLPVWKDNLSLFGRAISISPGDPLVQHHLAEVHLGAGRPAQAASLLRASLSRLPDDPMARFNLALALDQLGRDGEIAAGDLPSIEKVIEAHPEELRGRLLLAELLWREGRREEAVARWQELADTAPETAEKLFATARLRDLVGSGKEAAALYRRALTAPAVMKESAAFIRRRVLKD